MNKKPNIIKDKTYKFALDIINIYKQMIKQNEFILYRQLRKDNCEF
jgi:hypothetical protein